MTHAAQPQMTDSDRAQRCLDRHCLVSAGAGAGKTYALTRRYAHAVIQGVHPRQILAVTFTRKAAGDMRVRVREVLQACALDRVGIDGDALDPAAIDRIHAALDALNDAPINTFHGCCADLLRRFPLAAGVDPDFTLIEPAAAFQRQADAAGEFLETVAAEPRHALHNPLRRLLACYDFADVVRAVAGLRGLLPEVRQRLGDRERHRGQLAREFAELDVLGRLADGVDLDKDRELATRLAALKGADPPEFDRLFGLFRDLKTARGLDSEAKTVREFLRDVLLGKLQNKVIAPEASARAADRLGWLLDIAGADNFPSHLSDHELDYDGLEVRTLDLLANDDRRGHVRQTLDLRHIFVDEYQDTNTVQQTIVYRLLGLDGPDAAARGLPEGPPWLFAVGDPKQSIYRFRGAEVEVFSRTRQHIRAGGAQGLELSLQGNWRSTPDLVAFFNHLFDDREGVFSRYLQADAAPFETAYTPMTVRGETEPPPGVPASPGAAPVGCLLLSAVGKSSAGSSDDDDSEDDGETDSEAAWIARQILHLTRPRPQSEDGDCGERAGPEFCFRDVVVLRYSVANVRALTREFDRRDIPHFVVGTRALLDRLEVQDVIAWLRVLARPDDDLALAACAKQPWIGLTDRDLWTLKTATEFRLPTGTKVNPGGLAVGDLARSFRCQLVLLELDGALAATEDGQRINRVLGTLRTRLHHLEASAGRVPAPRLVEEIIACTGMRCMWAGWRNPDAPGDRLPARRRIANLEQFVMLTANGAASVTDPGDLLDWLDAVAGSQDSAADAQLLAEDDDVVRIMTIHQAKGLEFPVVFVMRIDSMVGDRGRRKPLVEVIDRRPVMTCEDPAKPVNSAGRTDPLSLVAKHAGKLKDAAERRRLFYVAVTRAKQRLFLSGNRRQTRDEAKFESIAVDANAAGWVARRFGLEPDADAATEALTIPEHARTWLWPGVTEEAPPALPPSPPNAICTVPAAPARQVIRTLNPSRVRSGDTSAAVPDRSVDVIPPPPGRSASPPKDAKLARIYGDLFHAFMARWDFVEASAGTLHDRLARDMFAADAAARAAAEFLRACTGHFAAMTLSDGRSVRGLFAAALAAGQLHREYPFTHWRPAPAPSGDAPAEWVSGTIDVLIEAEDGIHVYDYKTGSAPASHYALQMQLYRDAVAAAVGGAVTVHHPVLLYVESTPKTEEAPGP